MPNWGDGVSDLRIWKGDSCAFRIAVSLVFDHLLPTEHSTEGVAIPYPDYHAP